MENISILFINLNNIIVKLFNKDIDPNKILILLPRCMQSSSCSFNVTCSINNCHRCHSCNIGGVLEIAEKYKITSIEVVSGGTAARNIIRKIRPKLIVAIACERELITGIADVRIIPVIGVLNQRPKGPCKDTVVDINKLTEVLEKVIIKRKQN